MRISTILVPTDFSPNAQIAFKRAWDLALQTGSRLYVLHVQDESTLRLAIKEGLLRDDSTEKELAEQVEQLIDRRFAVMLAGFDESEVAVERLSQRGDPKSEVTRFAEDVQADLIAIGLTGAGAVERMIGSVFGSVADSVIRKSPCPVLVVRIDHGSE
ncbi:MAG TPA: universal stress protein [Blastocatellia bacterium]|nr:universal stress protein [Blastocatellia bacterium]